jgi:hypothetical protein
MGLLKLKLFSKPARSAPVPAALPNGSFSVDASGRVVSSTVPRGFPEPLIKEIARVVLAVFRGGREAKLRLTEFTVQYSALKITAREMRGGAMVYLTPLGPAGE